MRMSCCLCKRRSGLAEVSRYKRVLVSRRQKGASSEQIEKLRSEKNRETKQSGRRIVVKEIPEARRAVSSCERLKRWKRRSEAMRAERGIAIGKMVGIWYTTKSPVLSPLELSAKKRAISLKRKTRRTEMNVPIERQNTLQ